MRTWLACALSIALVAPRSADACGPCQCDQGNAVVNGWSGTRPTNTRFFLWLDSSGSGQSGVTLTPVSREDVSLVRTDDHTAVPCHFVESGGDRRGAWFVPDADLAPNTQYDLRFGSTVELRFTTEAVADHDAPTLGGATIGSESVSRCDPVQGVTAHLVAPSETPGLVEIEVQSASGATRTAFVDSLAITGWTITVGHDLGPDTCMGRSELGPLTSETYSARLRLYDRAGNVSPWVDTGRFTFGVTQPQGCGARSCAARPGSIPSRSSAPGVLLGFAVLVCACGVLVRRRAQSSPNDSSR